jgi:hypothetical protein
LFASLLIVGSCSVLFTVLLVGAVQAVFVPIADQLFADEFVVIAVKKNLFGRFWKLQRKKKF